MFFAALLPLLAPILGDTLKRVLPDPAAAEKAQADITMALVAKQGEIDAVAGSIIKAEAESEHWLTSSWRPITMLTFVALIVARAFGFTAPNVTEAEWVKLWGLVELGLGGYVVGRTAEKVIPSIVGMMKK